MRLLLVIVLLLSPVVTSAVMVITEVMCNPEGIDTDGEWVRIKNIGNETIDLTGWKFNDGSNHNLNVPPENGGTGSMQISAGESVLLANKASEVSGESTIIDTVMALSNSGDTLKLIDASGTEVHTITYEDSDVLEGESCFSYDSSATTTEDGSAETVHTNIITTVNEVTKYRTVEIQPPQDITIREIDDMVMLVGSEVSIMPEVHDATGKSVSPKCTVVFGDGAEISSCSALHVYEFAGVYTVNIHAKKSSLQDTLRFSVEVVEPELQIRVNDDYKYIEIINNASSDAGLYGWVIKIDYKKFTIPNNTIIPAQSIIKISSKTIQVDIAKYGGVARLVDALGSTIADSSEYVGLVVEESVDENMTDQEEVLEAIEQEGPIGREEVIAEVVKIEQSVLIANGQRASLTINNKSIIGMKVHVPKFEMSKEVEKDEVVKVVKIVKKTIKQNKSIQQLAAVNSANVPGESWNISDALPQESSKWLVGLFALLGIASVPVLMSKGKDQLQESRGDTDNDRVEGFTIEEIK